MDRRQAAAAGGDPPADQPADVPARDAPEDEAEEQAQLPAPPQPDNTLNVLAGAALQQPPPEFNILAGAMGQLAVAMTRQADEAARQ